MDYGSIERDSVDDLREIPKTVQEVLKLDSWTNEKVHYLTFRYFLLSFLFVVPGAFVDTMNSYRTTSAPYSILFVQFLCDPAGQWLAKVLPNKVVRIGRFRFNLNPGPWSIKESVLVTLTAASGATGNQGTAGLSLAEVFYNRKVDPVVALTFMYCIVWTGYSFGAIARNFVLYDPQFVWPKALMQTALFKAQEHSDRRSNSQMRMFTIGLAIMFVWQFFPEFVFPLTSSLAFLCYMAPNNHVVNFWGSGLGGLGFMNISLDWSNVSSSVMLSPYWTIVVQFCGFALMCWVLLPFFKWYDHGKFSLGLMDNKLLLANGTAYPTLQLMTPDLQLNETAYHLLGPVHFGTQRLANIFFDYAAYISAIVWIACFGIDDLRSSYRRLRCRYTNPSHMQHTDRINKIYAKHDDVPNSWFGILFLISFVLLSTVLLATDQLFIPWKTYIAALLLGAVIVTPMAYLYAISNFQLAIGTVNELLYGLMMQTPFFAGSNGKHPCGASIYGAIAGNCWYRAQYILQDQKIGMYNDIPPKLVFFSQIFGDLIGVPINYMSLRWVINSKFDYLKGVKVDPMRQWTGQVLTNYNSNAIQYVLLGPKRVFEHYPLLPLGFVVGALAPLLVFWISKYANPQLARKFNVTILFSTMSKFYGNISTGYLTQFLVGTFTMHYMYNYRHQWFQKYNYVLAAAFDTGFNLANLAIFCFFGSKNSFQFPEWWGNDRSHLEKCYAL
ncbi:hypothetical protein OGAPHI_006964 [Ogataea philodendri]|uniref:Oligopeptide transporter n=1 Tax=Ogataea philodendri TaxID=1378263 RepID=A0A9P8SZ53_9ASCO|nr:uncharacterized protein OGAPHI_006964 [Ogataea philodendri]KAH3660378.1 hypothetical protein OGAPHI_006964 [Ogataea philodendri]